jgi:uncharacterized protein
MIWVFLSVALGGILKGATGAGAPLVAIPAIALYHPEGVKFAVTIFVLPSLLSNIWQSWSYRRHFLAGPVVWVMSATGVLGIATGSWMLSALDPRYLSLLVAIGVIIYVTLRLGRVSLNVGKRTVVLLAGPVGLAAGLLQGSSGISAPVTLTFLNALRLPRNAFIATVSTFFLIQTAVQLPALAFVGLLTWERLLLSFAAFVVLAIFMPVGEWLGGKLSPGIFDKIILCLLAVLAAKLVFDFWAI